MGAGASTPAAPPKKRVCIVGGGVAGERRRCCTALLQQEWAGHWHVCPALSVLSKKYVDAGMACAWSLSRFPERFDVEVWEALPETGGVASTCAINGGESSVGLAMLAAKHFYHRWQVMSHLPQCFLRHSLLSRLGGMYILSGCSVDPMRTHPTM